MNKKLIILVLMMTASMHTYAQMRLADTAKNATRMDSLSLDYIINEVIQNHPTVQQAKEALNAADARIGLAKAGYYPDVDVTASYARLGPTPSLNFPGLGKFTLYPADNYNAALNFNQVIYDFGKTSKNVAYENENKNIALQTIEQLKQKIAITATSNFYSMVFLQEAINIKNEQISTLNKHLEFIQKKEQSGSATQYEILATQVRISNVESQKIDLETSLKIQRTILNSLLGQPERTTHLVKKALTIPLPDVPADSLVSYAIQNRDELKLAREKNLLAKLQYDIVKSQNYPVINIFASGGDKNGYLPNLNTMTWNFAAGVGVKIPIVNGTRNKNNLLLVKSSIHNTDYETEIIRRNISDEIIAYESDVLSALQKVKQFELQLEHAQKAQSLAEVNYKTGAITNLDLLDSNTSVSESSLNLLKTKIDYVLSIYKLKMSLGKRLY